MHRIRHIPIPLRDPSAATLCQDDTIAGEFAFMDNIIVLLS